MAVKESSQQSGYITCVEEILSLFMRSDLRVFKVNSVKNPIGGLNFAEKFTGG